MNTRELTPPRWLDAILRSLLRPVDREPISGDLLEEYRAVRSPFFGPLWANLWYAGQVLSLLWRLIRPAALVLAAQGVFLALTVFRPGHHAPHQDTAPLWVTVPLGVVWYGSIVGTPGVSLLDAAIYFLVAYRGVKRTGLIKTGALVAAASSIVGLIVLFSAAAVVTPGLAVALLTKPVLLLILSVYVLVPVSYAVLVGTLAGSFSRWLGPPRGVAAVYSTFKESPLRKRITDLLFRREVAGVILFLVIPKVFLNDLGRSAFLGYCLGVIATWIAYAIGLRRPVSAPTP